MNFSCILIKTLIKSARAVDAIKNTSQFGINLDTSTIDVDFARIMRDMRAARGATRKGLGSGWKTR